MYRISYMTGSSVGRAGLGCQPPSGLGVKRTRTRREDRSAIGSAGNPARRHRAVGEQGSAVADAVASGNVGGAWCDEGMETFTLVPRGPFSLAASIRFLEGFTPAWYPSAPDGVLELAFPAEGSWRTVGVRVSQAGETVTAEVVSPAEPGAGLVAEVRPQVERILSLDVDGSGFPAVGERDPVVGQVQRRYPGLRPVGFWSPYEAAAWTIIGHRIRITQAAAIKARMAERLGEPVSFGGRVVHAFPSPQRLAGLDTFPGLAGRKPEWLRALARAALDGPLDAPPLRALPAQEAPAGL